MKKLLQFLFVDAVALQQKHFATNITFFKKINPQKSPNVWRRQSAESEILTEREKRKYEKGEEGKVRRIKKRKE